MNFKHSRVYLCVLQAYGATQRSFTHMRMWTYLAAGGPMLTVKVV